MSNPSLKSFSLESYAEDDLVQDSAFHLTSDNDLDFVTGTGDSTDALLFRRAEELALVASSSAYHSHPGSTAAGTPAGSRALSADATATGINTPVRQLSAPGPGRPGSLFSMARPGPLFQATGNELDMIDGFSDISSDEDNFGRRSMDSSPSAGLHNSATPPSTGGPPRLGLISRLPAPSSNGPHVVGRMVFDPVSMRWVRVSAARSASRISDTEADDEGAGEEDSTDEDEADIFDGLGFDEASLASGQTHDGSREKSLEDAFVVTHSMMAEWRAAERQYQRMVGHAAPGPSSSATLSGPSASSSSASLGPGQGPATSDPGASSSSSVPSSAGPWAGLAAIEPRSHFQMIRDIAARLV